MTDLRDTLDPGLTSWVDSANAPDTDFPIQNLPYGVFRPAGTDLPGRAGVAIGTSILDLHACLKEGLFSGAAARAAEACTGAVLNDLMELPAPLRRALREALSQLLRTGSPERARVAPHLVPMDQAEMLLPAAIGDYTDFYASIHHATNVGKLFRPDEPLLPNYKFVPIGYHGRSSSIVVSGTPVRRPEGQTRDDGAARPTFAATRQLDYELEVGCFVGPGNPLGSPVPVGEAGDRLFGLCLLNDWSARDIQKWEYQPLGPFLAKNFATSISPWIVTMEALAPFRVPAAARPPGDPEPLPYLRSPDDAARGGMTIGLEVLLSTAGMRARGEAPRVISRTDFRSMYWTFAQMAAHHTSGGCNLRPGDLLGSGTVSGPEPGTAGCLLELTRRGKEPVVLGGGETRSFLADGDEVILRGSCAREGAKRIGFGECRGIVRS